MTDVTVKELTVEEIRDILENAEGAKELHVIEMLFPDELPVKALVLSTGKSEGELSAMGPGEILALMGRVKEKNPFFAQMLERLAALGREALARSAAQ